MQNRHRCGAEIGCGAELKCGADIERMHINGDLELWGRKSGNSRKTSFDYFYIVKAPETGSFERWELGHRCVMRSSLSPWRSSASRRRHARFANVTTYSRASCSYVARWACRRQPLLAAGRSRSARKRIRVGKSAASRPHNVYLRSEVRVVNIISVTGKLSSNRVCE